MFDAYWRWQEALDFDPRRPLRRGPWPRDRVARRRYLAVVEAARALGPIGQAPALRGPGRVRDGRAALFWFREAAAECGRSPGQIVFRARDLAYALAAVGIAVREIAVRNPGRVLWSNRYQVLAMPEAPVPRAFR